MNKTQKNAFTFFPSHIVHSDSILKPGFLVQFVVFGDVYCYRCSYLFSVLILAIVVDELTIGINQVHYDGVINL